MFCFYNTNSNLMKQKRLKNPIVWIVFVRIISTSTCRAQGKMLNLPHVTQWCRYVYFFHFPQIKILKYCIWFKSNLHTVYMEEME